MAQRMRAYDWSRTPLGPPASWPQSLKTAVRILLTSRFAMWMAWGPELTFFCNDAYLPTVGVKEDWVLGARSDQVWAEIWPDIGPRIEHVLKTGEATWDDRLRLYLERRGFSEETYHTFSYSPLSDDAGVIEGMLCVVTEVSERVIGERQLATLRDLGARLTGAATREEVMAAVEAGAAADAPDLPFLLLYLLDEPGSARLAARHGLAQDDPAAAPEVQLGAPSAPWPLARALREAVQVDGDASGRAGPALILPVTGSEAGAPLGILVAGLSPHRALDEGYRGFLGLLTGQVAAAIARADQFERERERARALAEIDAAKTVFFSNVSHEFRTPLTLMLSPLEELLRAPDSLPLGEGRGRLEVAQRNAQRLLKLVNALLDFSRIEAGRVQAVFEPTDLSAYTAELASNFRSAMAAAGLTFVVDCLPLDEPAFVDRDMWEKVVLNLISNAFKFTLEGKVLVRLRRADGGLELVVEDTGVGISPEDAKRLFERFYRVEGARGRSLEGTGIGLSLVHELVRLHGGRISVDSEAGQGSRFRVWVPSRSAHLPPDQVRSGRPALPASSRGAYVEGAMRWLPPAAESASPPALPGVAEADLPAPSAQGKRVLLADDNADMRLYVLRLLRSQGYAVDAVGDGEAALEAALADPPDLVLTDVMMPRRNGFQLLQALREDPRTAAIPVIMLSARAGEEATVEGLGAGADAYLVKPFSARELLARVEGVLRLAEIRRDAAEALQRENLRIRTLFEQAPGFIAIFAGKDHVYQFANAAYRRLVGGRPVVGRPIREALPELQGQGYFELLDRVFASGERFVGREAPVQLQSPGEAEPREVLLDFIYEPIREADGSVTGIFVEGYEVTERVAARAALLASEEQLRLATDAAEIGLWDVDNVRQTLYWPSRVKAMFGISPDVPVTMEDFYNGLHPEDRDAVAAAFATANDPAQRAVYDVEYRTIGKEDRVVRWVAAKGRGVFDAHGRCIRVLGTGIDITERKAREARLEELNDILERRIAEALAERKLLADIVEGTDAFVQVADLDFNWLAINRASADEFERIFGVRPRVGDNMLGLLADQPEHQAAVRAVWGRALAGEEFTEVDEFGEATRDRRCYEMKFNTLRDKDGRRIGAYQFVYDVTERRRDQVRLAEAEEALRQTRKLEAMGQLTGGVAHDFNNLLTPIIGSLDRLLRTSLGDRDRRLVEGGLQSAERARTLVQRLLAFARRQPLQPQPVDVAALVQGMAALIDSTTGPQIRVVVDAAPDLPAAKADANQLEMAILNLSVNARDAMESGGALRISADVPGEGTARPPGLAAGAYVRISVADTGTGMNEAVAARAIEPFFSTKGVGKGTGLGLSMVHGLASQLGGALAIHTREGFGTNVELWLPVSDQPAPSAGAAQPAEADGLAAGRTVLLVDDEDAVRAVTADMLSDLGFTVIEANSGEAALDRLDRGLSPELLITDHLMPGMNGVDLARAARERRPSLGVLVISGYAETEGLAPDLPRLAKPFRQAELSAKLAELGLDAAG